MSSISDVYRQLRKTFDNRTYETIKEYEHGSSEDFESLMLQLTDHKKKNLEFFEKYEYDWVLEKENYDCYHEAFYQLYVVKMLSEIYTSRKELDMKNICVRISYSANYYPECLFLQNFKYIVIPFSFMKLLQEVSIIIFEILSAQSHSLDEIRTPCISFHLPGKFMEKSIQENYPILRSAFDRFVRILVAKSRFEFPYNDQIEQKKFFEESCKNHQDKSLKEFNEENGNKDRVKLALGLLINDVEVFAICHELTHILTHDFTSSSRIYTEEFDADRGASSLFIILAATKNMTHYHAAPALFFILMKLSISFRKKNKLVDHICDFWCDATMDEQTKSEKIQEVFSPDFFQIELIEELNVDYRILAYGLYDKVWGVPWPTEQNLFYEEVNQLSTLIAACECRYSEMMNEYMEMVREVMDKYRKANEVSDNLTFWPLYSIDKCLQPRFYVSESTIDELILETVIGMPSNSVYDEEWVQKAMTIVSALKASTKVGTICDLFTVKYGNTV